MSFKSKLAKWLGIVGERGYGEIARAGDKRDWITSGVSEDGDIWQNIYILRDRSRDEFKSNPYFQKYREQLFANVFGAEGIYLRMKVKEQEDRIIHTPDEKHEAAAAERACQLEWMRRRFRVFHDVWQKETGRQMSQASLMADYYASQIDRLESNREATIRVGEPDLFANKLIEDAWKRWKRPENCDVRGVREYTLLCNLRLLSAARDGGIFIRLVKDFTANKFGFAIQLINDEWCDSSYSEELPNGNVVRMGIEYQHNNWGLGKPVAYYFIRRQATDWQHIYRRGYSGRGVKLEHDRIPAEEIIHYTRRTDADGTRPAPWATPVLQKGRHLDKYEEAEVIAARVAACKMGWFYSDLVADPGAAVAQIDPTSGIHYQNAVPGAFGGLPYGVKFEGYDPKHPNGNFEQFRKGMLRSWCAGLIGADYNIVGNDLEGISFSAGRLGRLDSNEMWKILQSFDIKTAELKIFEEWLKMALTSGQVPLPMAKFEKFNRPVFQGRRWSGIDEVKEATAAAMRIANKTSSRTMECAANSTDFEEIAFELAEEKMLLEGLGLDDSTAKSDPSPAMPAEEGVEVEVDSDEAAAVEASIQDTALNGAQVEALLSIVSMVTSGEIDSEAANALIGAAFPLMTEDEITAITSKLDVTKPAEVAASNGSSEGGNGRV